MKKQVKKYVVYGIFHNGVCKYVGYTSNIKLREYKHNYFCKKRMNKLIYNYWNNLQLGSLKLIPIKYLDNRTEAKRYEMFLILQNHFSEQIKLLQKIPSIGH